MPAPPLIVDLCERYEYNRNVYRSGNYNEAQLRQEFLNPFFGLEGLGWDVNNKEGYAEAYKEVIHEDAIKISGSNKAPDYSFRIGGTRKFFVEAKKPSVNISEDVKSAFQLRRYAWSAKLPLSILSNFEEFAVYDCRIQPKENDKPIIARRLRVPYTEYIDRWDEIADVFSRAGILKGAFDKYSVDNKAKRGTAEVDTAFLKEIEAWREQLAHNLALRNPNLTSRELNFAVQITIDRIIFLRICEDRGIEELGRLQSLIDGKDLYPRLVNQFQEADERYNSGLFHLHVEKGRPNDGLDTLTPRLVVDDKTLKAIIGSLYYPAPYAFEVFPADILGQVYEQFLGKVIRRKGQSAVVEEKPEVKKAGGVYYTPTYIVNYLVEETVGKLLDGSKTIKQAEKIRILDPACGSGSFLIQAYQQLLDWHYKRYLDEGPEKHAKGSNPKLYRGVGGIWRLTTSERKRVLLANIYGVDIDPQAVEVTKLSLLLKLLEGETQESIKSQFSLSLGRVLPDLDSNIKCGNSLIGTDFYDQQQLELLDEDEIYRVNVFDWNSSFAAIMHDGGFDAVIGNPPYLNIDDVWGQGDKRQRYIKRAYPAIYNDKTDILFYFLAKAVQVGKKEIGFIVSRAFLEAYKADKLRHWITENADVREIIDFRNFYVFPRVGITTATILLNKETVKTANCYRLQSTEFKPETIRLQKQNSNLFDVIPVAQERFTSKPWLFAGASAEEINQKIDGAGEQLSRVLLLGQGMQTGLNGVFGNLPRSRAIEWGLPKGLSYTRARNSDIQRYHIEDSGELLLYVEDVQRFDKLPAEVQAHLKAHMATLKDRAAFKRGNCEWWKYTWPLHKDHMNRAKLYCPYLATSNRFAIDEKREYLGLTDTTVLFDASQPERLHYLLGLLNSKLLTFRFRYIGKLKSGGILEYFWNSISKLPIRRIDFDVPEDKMLHDRIVTLVEHMLNLRVQLLSAVGHSKTIIQRQIETTDQQIDNIVYKLYGLNDDEIKVVIADTA